MFSKEDNLWNKLSEFEQDLADFFAAHGLEAEPLITMDGSQNVMVLSKIQAIPTLQNTKGVNLPKGPKAEKSDKIVKNLTKGLSDSYDKLKKK